MNTSTGLRAGWVLLLVWLPEAWAGSPSSWRYSGNAGIAYDSNPANVRSEDSAQPASFLAAGLSAERAAPLTAQSGLLLRLSLNGEGYARHEALSNARAAAMLRWSLRPGSDFYTPLLALWSSASYAEYDSRIRDGVEVRAGLFVQEQLTTTLRTRLGAQWTERKARGDAFEVAGHSVSLNVDWAAGGPTSLYLGYQYYDGDLVSTNALRERAVRAASAVTADDAFGGVEANQFAFRLRSHAHLATLGYNYALTRTCALDAQLQGINASANTGSRYRRYFSALSLLFRF